MIYSIKEFEVLTKKHGGYASWAIWEYSKDRYKEKSVKPIYDNINLLNSTYVIIGLNISNAIDTWSNFRGGKHDRKLKYAFNDSYLKGAYMTDLFKNIINPKSTNLYQYIIYKPKLIQENILNFREEMRDIKISAATSFIILGTEESLTAKLFRKYFQRLFPNNKVIFYRHYSSRGTDRNWVEGIWEKLNINLNFS